MVKINKVLAGAVCMLALLGAGCASSAKADQSSPEAAVNSFLTAIQKQDKTTAKSLAAPGSDVETSFEEGWAQVTKIPLTSFKVINTEEDTVNVEMKMTVEGEEKTSTNGVQVMQKDGKWYIVDL